MERMFSCVEDICDYLNGYRLNKKSETASSIGIVFEENGRYHWYDNGTCKVLQIDKNMLEFFTYIRGGNLIPGELRRILMSNGVNEDDLIHAINEEDLLKGVIIDDLCSGVFLKYTHQQIQSGVSQLILELTEECNMRCKYCIYQDSYKGNRNFGNKSMTRETAFKAIDLMAKEGDKEEVSITFYGGEPLLEYKLLRDCIEYSKKALTGRQISYSFTTNLTLLTDEMVDYFKTVDNLSIMCSIDGPKDIHDSYRVFANGSGTFDTVFENFRKLSAICEYNPSFHLTVNAVYGPPYSVDKIEKIDNFFSSLTFLPDTFSFQLGYPSFDTLPLDIQEKFYGEDLSLQEWNKENLKKHNFLMETRSSSLEAVLQKIHDRNISKKANNETGLNGCCVPGFRRLYVQTSGNFLPCERIGRSPTIGNIEEGISLNKIYRKYLFEFADCWKDKCNDCWSSKLCSTCYVERMAEEGVKKSPKEELCKYERDMALYGLEIYHELLHDNPSALEILNEREKI